MQPMPVSSPDKYAETGRNRGPSYGDDLPCLMMAGQTYQYIKRRE